MNKSISGLCGYPSGGVSYACCEIIENLNL